ncbi:Multiple sugar-binding protein [Paenibacillus allorhizoplanae]|uniref:Multiple sugar-binding protein n=1 Tax=Paenibacillus allorhizoplanae TaxID=2905648 RepID=A0ABN8FUU4_9BACL|nr:extracellular solute-binding protein [Paenibacillus allorhizoplanae]CAH1192705.1 Multiple sugar-binding protein [Paenibacillus allorhizoplanae]
MKKTFTVIVSIGIMASMLAGCGSKTETVTPAASSGATNSAKSTEMPKEKVTLTYMASQDWIKDSEMQLAKKFEAETGIHIDYQIVPSDQYQNILKTKLNAKEAPDIFGGQDGQLDLNNLYGVEKNAVDLSGEEWVKREDPLFVEQGSYNKKVYALTIWDPSYDWVIVYNKKIYEKLNLKVPTTYADFKAVSEKIKSAGTTPIYEPVSDGWHHVLWFPELGPKFEEANPGLTDKLNSNKEQFANVPIMEQALTQLNELAKSGYMGDNYFSNTYADTEKNMASGKYAMTVYNLGLPAQIEKAFPEVKADTFGYFLMPLADNQILNVNPAAPSKFIYSGSKHIDLAKKYFQYLTKPENLQFFLDNEPKFLALNFKDIKNRYTPDQKAFFDTYGKKQGTVFQTSISYLNPQWMDIGKDISAMFSGKMQPKDILKSIDKRRSDAAKAAKDPAWAQ